MPQSLSRSFAHYVASLQYESLPPQVVDKMKASVLHALVTGIIGAGTAHGQSAIHLIKSEEAQANGATILVDGSRATRAGAAFANSKLMHATNQSDSYQMLIHPGPCVIPAALAAAELGSSSGQEFLTAVAAGYEVESRIAGDFIPSTQARGFRSSAVYGTLGATVSTGKLLKLDEDQMVTALALACTFTGGTGEGPRSGGREMMFHEPNATRNAVMAALLAQENIKGSETSLEGDAGFYNAFVGNNRGELSYVFQGPDQVSLGSVREELGSRWELMHITPKIYPTAGYNCPVIECMAQLRAKHPLSPEDIESIVVDMNWLETLYPSPAFPNPARHRPGVASTHYFAAYTCVHGHYPSLRRRIEPGEQSPGEDQRVIDLLSRTQVVGHKERPAFAPRITVRMRNGTVYQEEFQGNELEWDWATEVSRITPLFSDMDHPREKLDGIVHTVAHLEQEPGVERVVSLCVRG